MENTVNEERQITFHIEKYQKNYENLLEELQKEKIIERIWKKDHTVWSCKPDEITNRLGWLKSPGVTLAALDEINGFVDSVIKDGIKHVLLMGMGGSSLAPEVFSLTFGSKDNYPDLYVIDSTHPEYIKHYAEKLEPSQTLYIVSTKSGGTVETFSFMKYFYNNALNKLGKENAGKHFAAITDPGSGLQDAAEKLNFRKTFLNDPDIGGRYSALSFFGIVPAALIGVDIKELLKRAEIMQCSCVSLDGKISNDNSSARLGLIIGMLAHWGKDKLTFMISPKIASFGSWAEQLIAESTGKLFKGIVPIDGENIVLPEEYSNDRVFVQLILKGDNSFDKSVEILKEKGFPVIKIVIDDIYDLGAEFFRWEMATAVMGWCLNIQPFDQPNVESAKVLARKMVEEYKKNGQLPELKETYRQDEIKVYGDISGESLKELFDNFFKNFNAGNDDGKGRSYICLQAYLDPDHDTTESLQKIRSKVQKKYKSATTLGYGPRFLHSTGQLHKGDAGKGLFIQFISSIKNDIAIPDDAGEDDKSSISFGILIKSQALGDRQALIDAKRKVITIDLGSDIAKSLKLVYNSI